MDTNTAIALSRQVLLEALLIAAPILGVSLVVGVVVALLQALTSLQEQTVAMIPKLLTLVGALFVMLPWILRQFIEFTQRMLLSLSTLGGGS
ncbi:MAG: flagellar biosynthetic protein FliQ [Planctomycetes bacterium]|nr:flagellar biosynthetic protein FliQ [Planctomycetota bacterium]